MPFCALFFLNDAGPPSSPRDVMTRSLNFGFGSGGRSAGAPAVPASTCGSCKSTLALERKVKGGRLQSSPRSVGVNHENVTYYGSFSSWIFSHTPYGLAVFCRLAGAVLCVGSSAFFFSSSGSAVVVWTSPSVFVSSFGASSLTSSSPSFSADSASSAFLF